MDRSEQLISSAKASLSNIRVALSSSPTHWTSYTSSMRTCISQADQSRIMYNNHRLEERIWIINEVQSFAYFISDNGGLIEFASWCEREWNRVLGSDPYHVGALKGLGQAWLSKAQYWLAKIHREEGSPSTSDEDDDGIAERRRHTADYVEARATLLPAVDFSARAVQSAQNQCCLTGELLALRAEACMSLGNVSPYKSAQQYFRDALLALRAAESITGYRLPSHLLQYLRENEYILSC
ncbi:hypothetical protein RUND412_005129 [Rhizina undulata]